MAHFDVDTLSSLRVYFINNAGRGDPLFHVKETLASGKHKLLHCSYQLLSPLTISFAVISVTSKRSCSNTSWSLFSYVKSDRHCSLPVLCTLTLPSFLKPNVCVLIGINASGVVLISTKITMIVTAL